MTTQMQIFSLKDQADKAQVLANSNQADELMTQVEKTSEAFENMFRAMRETVDSQSREISKLKERIRQLESEKPKPDPFRLQKNKALFELIYKSSKLKKEFLAFLKEMEVESMVKAEKATEENWHASFLWS